MAPLTFENILIIFILIMICFPIIFCLVHILQLLFKKFFAPDTNAKHPHRSPYQNFDFRHSFFDNDVPQTESTNFQTINIFSNNASNPTINISMKSINNNFDEILRLSTLDSHDNHMERLITYGSNLCRSSYNLKWQNKHLKKLGSREQKISFLISNKIREEEITAILSFLPSNFCKLKMDEPIIRNGVKNFLENLKHPNIQNLIRFDVDEHLKFFVVVRNLEQYSLKDLIYEIKDPKLSYTKKYDVQTIGNPLNVDLIKRIGRQILLGLQYLHSMSYYHNHIHSGNIYIRGNNVVIGEMENYALNLTLKNQKHFEKLFTNYKNYDKEKFNSFHEIIDVLQFGQLIYEMTTGCELKMIEPDPNDYIFIPKAIGNVLKEIFPVIEEAKNVNETLTLQDILNNTSKMSEVFSMSKSRKPKYFCSLPKITIEELLYEEFFRDELDPFYKNQKEFPKFHDQITKAFIKQLNRMNYSR